MAFPLVQSTAEEKADFVRKVAAIKTGGKKLLLYCQYGVRSAAARQALAEMGIDSGIQPTFLRGAS